MSGWLQDVTVVWITARVGDTLYEEGAEFIYASLSKLRQTERPGVRYVYGLAGDVGGDLFSDAIVGDDLRII